MVKLEHINAWLYPLEETVCWFVDFGENSKEDTILVSIQVDRMLDQLVELTFPFFVRKPIPVSSISI